MKKLIRKWLGIEDLEKEVDFILELFHEDIDESEGLDLWKNPDKILENIKRFIRSEKG